MFNLFIGYFRNNSMAKNNQPKTRAKLIFQTLSIILFIVVCTYYIMKMIDIESDSVSLFFVGFALAFLLIVLLAIYIKYVSNIYSQIRNAKKNHKMELISISQNEKRHMKVIHNKVNNKHKKKGDSKKSKTK
jgi:Na+-transporting methylmalonyl-CoA/oxaloacetate decarboxylase gamma subunit